MKFNLPVIILKGTILMPESEIRLEYDDDISKSILEESETFHDNNILVVTQNNIESN